MRSYTTAAALPISTALWNPAWMRMTRRRLPRLEQLRDIDAWAREKASLVLAATHS